MDVVGVDEVDDNIEDKRIELLLFDVFSVGLEVPESYVFNGFRLLLAVRLGRITDD